MGAAGDVEKKPVGRVDRDQRRVAVAPVGQRLEQPAVGLRLGFDHIDRRMHGAGVGDAHAGLELQRLSPLVESRDPLRVAVAMTDDERQPRLRLARTPGPSQALPPNPFGAEEGKTPR